MTGEYYMLDDGGNAVLCDDLTTWAEWYATSANVRRVALATVGPLTVSTVFLALDHNFGSQGEPVLWETMIFGAPGDEQPQWRYTSREAAVAGHEEAIAEAKRILEETQP